RVSNRPEEHLDSRQAYIILNMMQGVGPVTVRTLAAALGSVEAILAADKAALGAVGGVGPDKIARILEQRTLLDPVKEEAAAAALGAYLVTPVDPGYPKRLLQIYDPPLALYVQGTLLSRDEHGVAIVGSRRTSHYGMETAERLAFQLAESGVTVISGLARGIDTAAHRGALKAKGRTVAVLGGGLDCLFPQENAELAGQIMLHGCVMSEYPLGRQPDKTTFPVRNRIVSGLSQGVTVVECDVASGAMITARQAMEQGRTVFAVPGRIDSFGARGPHKLIRDGACLVQGVEDILNELGSLIPAPAGAGATRSASRPPLTEPEAMLVGLISEDGEADLDGLVRRSGRQASEVSALLLGLEMKRLVKMLPGQRVGLRTS
ncbi:MAG: DNA-processing protein DprA, partial [bacterium]